MTDVTRILSAIEQGDPQASEQLLPLVYEELRRLAVQKMAQEKPGQTLQATALVHEAYLRLVGSGPADSTGIVARPLLRRCGRGHAADSRWIERDDKQRLKRGGGCQRIELDQFAAVEQVSDDHCWPWIKRWRNFRRRTRSVQNLSNCGILPACRSMRWRQLWEFPAARPIGIGLILGPGCTTAVREDGQVV